ncbi:MAG: hypothetical protein GY929_00810 [Actinomycetia bacterium]|nr:hypothetical protein [Actinomycetes bacterium]
MNGPVTAVLGGDPIDHRLLGGKGGSLADLIEWGLQVPATGVATTEAYHRFAAQPPIEELTARIRAGERVSADEVDEVFLSAAVEAELATAIRTLARRVGEGALLAARSSATVEDLAGSSFAGQYQSLLNIDPTDAQAVLDSYRLVAASLWHPAPVAYRQAFGIDEDEVAMAVVFMAMVAADQAGVVFTVDPIDPHQARVEVVAGLGESLVSGERTPDVHVLPRDHRDPGGIMVEQALDAALRVEDHTGLAQDVEWAWADDRLWVVQARPITVGDDHDGFDDPIDDTELTTAGITEMLPGVLPPLLAQINQHLVDEAFRRLLGSMEGVSLESTQSRILRRVRGRAALDFEIIRTLADAVPGGDPDELDRQYFGSRRPDRAAAPDSDTGSGWWSRLRGWRHDLRVLGVRRRVIQDVDVVARAVAELGTAAVDLAGLSTPDLLARRARLLDLAVRAMAAELGVAAIAVSTHRRLELVLTPHLGVDEAGRAANAVTSGRGVTVTRPTAGSVALFGGPTWVELGIEPPDTTATEDISDPTAAPTTALEDRLRLTTSWNSSELARYLRALMLRRSVVDAVDQLRRREQAKSDVMTIGGFVRGIHLELGARLVGAGHFTTVEQIHLVSDPELRAGLEGTAIPPAILERRRRWLERYETEGPLPTQFHGLPDRAPAPLPKGRRLEGWSASAGRGQGVGRVLTSPTDDFEPGSVLVAQATDASWSPVFVKAAGVVLERGGPLSHAAILARELGLPAVLNVPGATRVLDGEHLVVDGDQGIVVRLDVEGVAP